jgi:Rrf2 family nitric oxide-sensitive transcriptional repressor
VNLKLQTDYALRTLLYLAHAEGLRPVDEIATVYAISRDHLFKIVQQLSRLGYVVSRAGRRGGVKLARPAEQILVGEVVAQMEGRNGVLECVKDPGCCPVEPGCTLRSMLIRAENAFYDTFGDATIADLIRPNAAVQRGGVYNLKITRRTAPPVSPA